MKHNRRWRNKTNLFIVVQSVLYGLFLYIDMIGSQRVPSNGIKFTIIVLCFCYVLFYQKSSNESILFYLRLALLFTVVSDLLILLLDYYYYGVISFIIVQQIYGIKLDYEIEGVDVKGKKLFRNIGLLRLFLQGLFTALICLLLSTQGIILDKLLIVTVFYFLSIVTNVIRSVGLALKDLTIKNNLLFAIGMLLFLLCDINVGIFNMTSYLSLSREVYQLMYSLSSILMWAFYAPSQVLITLSVRNLAKSTKKTQKFM